MEEGKKIKFQPFFLDKLLWIKQQEFCRESTALALPGRLLALPSGLQTSCISSPLSLPPPTLDDSIWQELLIKKKTNQTAFVLPQQTSLGKWCSLLSNSCSAQNASTRKAAGVTSYSPFRPGSLRTKPYKKKGWKQQRITDKDVHKDSGKMLLPTTQDSVMTWATRGLEKPVDGCG